MGWLLIASVMLSNLLLTCLARCSSPISYLQLKFWRAYAQEEGELIESYNAKHAKELAQRNLQSFFNQKPAEPIITPSNKDWEKISALYKFSTKGQYYSTLHRYVETCQEGDNGLMRTASIVSSVSADDHPPALAFVWLHDSGVRSADVWIHWYHHWITLSAGMALKSHLIFPLRKCISLAFY